MRCFREVTLALLPEDQADPVSILAKENLAQVLAMSFKVRCTASCLETQNLRLVILPDLLRLYSLIDSMLITR